MVSLRAWRGLLTFAQVVSASPFDGAPTSTGLPDRESRLNGRGPGPVTTRRRRGNALDVLLVDDPLLVNEYVALLEHNLEP